MATKLTEIVRFTGLAVGVPVAIAHGLNIDGRAQVPDLVLPEAGGFTVAADATNVTVTRTVDAASGAVNVAVWHWHTLVRVFGATNPPPGSLPDGSLTPQPFIQIPGTVTGVAVAGREALPEKWARTNVAANLTNSDLTQQVSTLFNTTKMIRAGSLLGLSTRLTEPITAGSLTVTVEINGVATTLTLAHTAASNASGGEATIAGGVEPFAAGDLVGITITTNGAFLPITTDLECWVEIDTD